MSETENEREKLLAEAKKEKEKGKLLSLLGFAMRAGKLSVGADRVCDEIRRHGSPEEEGRHRPPGVVILASDASENTKKRIRDACGYYRVRLLETEATSGTLASRVGKASAIAVLATFDCAFSEGILKAAGLPGANG